MPTTEINCSRRKIAIWVGGPTALWGVLLLYSLYYSFPGVMWMVDVVFMLLGFLAFSARLAWMLIRPPRLLLDDEGFALAGGFVRAPRKIRWRDVESFFIWPESQATDLIGFFRAPGAGGASSKVRFAEALSDAGWGRAYWRPSDEEIVAELEARRWAAAGARDSGDPLATKPRFPSDTPPGANPS